MAYAQRVGGAGPISPSASSRSLRCPRTLRFGRDAPSDILATFEREVRNLAV
jgi:hypothetical protein